MLSLPAVCAGNRYAAMFPPWLTHTCIQSILCVSPRPCWTLTVSAFRVAADPAAVAHVPPPPAQLAEAQVRGRRRRLQGEKEEIDQ